MPSPSVVPSRHAPRAVAHHIHSSNERVGFPLGTPIDVGLGLTPASVRRPRERAGVIHYESRSGEECDRENVEDLCCASNQTPPGLRPRRPATAAAAAA